MSIKLRIAFFGSSLVSSYWNGAATYYRGMIKALADLGHQITFYESDAFERQAHRDMDDPPWAEVVVYPATHAGVSQALKKAESADVVIKASGVGVFDEWLEREILNLSTMHRQMAIFWDVDAPATLQRLHEDPNDPFHSLIPQYDLVLTYGGGAPVISDYRALGAAECVPIYNALDPESHHPTPPDPRFSGHLGLLANRMPDREARIDEFFFQAAAHLPDYQFTLGGSGWESNRPELENIRYLGHVGTRDHNAFNVTPRAVLNVNRESMARVGYSPATRIFEAAGAGACIITDQWPGIEMFLEPDREILVAASGKEVAEQLAGLTPERSKRIGMAAMARVLSEHTYRHRAGQVESILLGSAVQ